MENDDRGNPWIYRLIGGILAVLILGALIPLLIAIFGGIVLVFLIAAILGSNR